MVCQETLDIFGFSPNLHLLPYAEFRGDRSRVEGLDELQLHVAALRQVGEAVNVLRVLEADVGAGVGRQGRRVEAVPELGGDPVA